MEHIYIPHKKWMIISNNAPNPDFNRDDQDVYLGKTDYYIWKNFKLKTNPALDYKCSIGEAGEDTEWIYGYDIHDLSLATKFLLKYL